MSEAIATLGTSGPARQAISRGMVALLKKHVGRGPSTTRTFINDDVVTVLLEDTLTEVERTLTRAGKADVVKQMRQNYQAALCDEAVHLVEAVTGREVRAYMTDHSVLPDFAVECFVLAPVNEDSSNGDSPCDEPAPAGSTA